jgi:hypothetical protein
VSQRSVFVAVALVLLLAAGGAAALVGLARREPAWYAAAATSPGPERAARSREFKNQFCKVYPAALTERAWQGQFTDAEVNSYFEEDFLGEGYDRLLLPEGISRPRVRFEPDRLRLAFRYERGLWKSVIGIDLRVWLPAVEPNVVALELEGFHAGSLPISAQSLLEKIAEVGRKNGIDVSWYRHDGHPVALLRFQPDQPRPTFQLQAVQLTDHHLIIQGRSIDQVPSPQPAEPAKPAAVP